jgi:hypothetical protein
MKTAVEWLFTQYVNKGIITIEDIEQAQKMEKEQIFKALIRGHNDCGVFTMQSECDEYYNKTFKTN